MRKNRLTGPVPVSFTVRHSSTFYKLMYVSAWWAAVLAFMSLNDFFAIYVGKDAIFDHHNKPGTTELLTSTFMEVVGLAVLAVFFAFMAGDLRIRLRVILTYLSICCIIAAIGRNSLPLLFLVLLFSPLILLWQLSSLKLKDQLQRNQNAVRSKNSTDAPGQETGTDPDK